MGKIITDKSLSKKDKILRNAASLFRARGFTGCSMRELADSLGIEAPSLYNHIGSKGELLQHICEKVAESFTGNMKENVQQEVPVDEKLENLIRFHIRFMMEDFDALWVANHEWKHLPPLHLKTFLQQRKDYENNFTTLVKQGIEAGQLKNLDASVVTLTILSAVRGLEFWQRKSKSIPDSTIENDVIHHLLKGIMK
ncbi:MAG: TetR/AcrR family transcriptional regulator [Ferruginibacter sp.]